MSEDERPWKPIKSAPFQTVVEVRNPAMDQPVLATRGYMTERGMHSDTTFFTSVYTPDKSGFGILAMQAGCLVCPTEWRPVEDA